jgi:DNA-binding MarR family transcriptional regulator
LRITDVEPGDAGRYRRNPAHTKVPSSIMKNPKAAAIPLENWTGYRFGLLATRLGNFIAPMYASRHDLTMPAWRSLAVIARHQPLTAKQLATLTSSDAFKVARAIELLVRRGLIDRDVDESDRRRASLRLTAEGRKVYKDIEKFVVRVERELMAVLDANEVAVLRRSLDKLDQQMESRIKVCGWEKFLKE